MPYLESELELVLHLVSGFVVWIRVTVRRVLDQFTHLPLCPHCCYSFYFFFG